MRFNWYVLLKRNLTISSIFKMLIPYNLFTHSTNINWASALCKHYSWCQGYNSEQNRTKQTNPYTHKTKLWHRTSQSYRAYVLEGEAIKNINKGFPGGTVVENPPANTGDTGSSPGLGRSHMPRSNWARGPQLLSLRVWSLCSATGEAAMVRGPHTARSEERRVGKECRSRWSPYH